MQNKYDKTVRFVLYMSIYASLNAVFGGVYGYDLIRFERKTLNKYRV